VQRGEKYVLMLQVKNTGKGAATSATALMRNASGDGVQLEKSRFELGTLGSGEARSLEFPISVTADLGSDELVLEAMIYDAVVGSQVSEKLRFRLQPAVAMVARSGVVEIKSKSATLYSGASTTSALIGSAAGKAKFASVSEGGGWVRLDLGGGKSAYAQTSDTNRSGGSAAPAYLPYWHSTPPILTLGVKGLSTSAATYTLSGTVNDETHVDDVYVFVSNPLARVEARKVFYRSNRGAKNERELAFSAEIPLSEGSNQITVIARESADVRSMKTLYIYRDALQTAKAP
jgi:Glucodextranase, domain B